jgi:hypothetical protein
MKTGGRLQLSCMLSWMLLRRRRRTAPWLGLAAVLGLAVACSRTGLDSLLGGSAPEPPARAPGAAGGAPGVPSGETLDATSPTVDATTVPDAGPVPHDAAPDVATDAPAEAAFDAPEDHTIPDAPFDVAPDVPLDVPADIAPDVPPDVSFDAPIPFDCVDAGITYIYLMDNERTLWRFYPPDNSFSPVGIIECPAPDGTSPFSMAVDSKGTAYVVFTDGHLYEVDVSDASCKATPHVPGEGMFKAFGMSFARDPDGVKERLYVADSQYPESFHSKGLGVVDTSTFETQLIGPFDADPGPLRIELTSTAGKLYGYADPGQFGRILEIDPATAHVSKVTPAVLEDVSAVSFAFAFWGGRFYVFMGANGFGGTHVHVIHPDTGESFLAFTQPGTLIVGAGVSTCAPE